MPKQTFFNLPDEKRQALLEIATDEFAHNSFQSVSISRLVERAGIAKGSFYQYFEDKEDLLFHLLSLASNEKLAFLKDHQPPNPDEGFFTYLEWMFEVGTRFQFAHPQLAMVGYRALYDETGIHSEAMAHLKAGADGYYRELIDLGISLGDIDAGIDRDLAAFILGTMLNELGNYLFKRLNIDPKKMTDSSYSEADLQGLRQVFVDTIQILKQGLGKRAS
jgi:AcrR family transcriptional regulator